MTQAPEPSPTLGYQSGAQAPRTSGVAIAALVVGIASMACIIPVVSSVAAIILGAMGISRTNQPGVQGRGMAVAGLVCGIVSLLLLTPLFIAILLPSLGRARESAHRVKCATNLRQVGQWMRAYAIDDPDGFYPPDIETLYAAAQPELKQETMICPSSSAAPGAPPFVLGQNLSWVYLAGGLKDASPATTPVAHCETHNHGNGTNVLYNDGSVRFVLTPQLPPEVQPTKP